MKFCPLLQRQILPVLLFYFICFQGFSQTTNEAKTTAPANPAQFGLGADLVSRYIWRGKDYGNSPAIQPNLSFSAGGFRIGAWGSYAFVSQQQKINDSTTTDLGKFTETDLYASYTLKGFTLTFTDYFFPNPLTPNENVKYFNYRNSTTGHAFELSLSWTGPAKFPLTLLAGTVIYGADKGRDSTGVYGTSGKNNYSTYLEASYAFTVKTIGIKPFIGAIPFGSAWYGPYGGVVNIGLTASKAVKITQDYSLPLYTSVITNPQGQSIFFVFGLSL